MVVLATAYDLTGEAKYRDGVLEGMDYLLGRNALNQSYVTGYGEVASHNQHSRWYAHQLDPALPNPPRGTLAGGPNSAHPGPGRAAAAAGLRAAVLLHRRHRVLVDQRADHQLELAAGLDLVLRGRPRRARLLQVRYTAHGHTGQLSIKNTGKQAINGWSLRWAFPATQRVRDAWGAKVTQSGPAVKAENLHGNRTIKPGHTVTFGFTGSTPGTAPEVFHLNGDRCA